MSELLKLSIESCSSLIDGCGALSGLDFGGIIREHYSGARKDEFAKCIEDGVSEIEVRNGLINCSLS